MRCSSFFSSYFSSTAIQTQKFRVLPLVSTVTISKAETRERLKRKQIFQEARERCKDAPMVGMSFSVEDFEAALNKFELDNEIGSVVRGTVAMTDEEAAVVDIRSKSLAYLPPEEACIYELNIYGLDETNECP